MDEQINLRLCLSLAVFSDRLNREELKFNYKSKNSSAEEAILLPGYMTSPITNPSTLAILYIIFFFAANACNYGVGNT